MDSATFAAERAKRLDDVDSQLYPEVKLALTKYGAGVGTWDEDLILAASKIWLDVFDEESNGGNRSVALARFRRQLRSSLAKTEQPDGVPDDGQVDRVTYWVSGLTVNNATTTGAFVRGVRYKKWVTMHDDHVRDVHIPADGQIVPIAGTFSIDGEQLKYPGDPVGPAHLWINCRCLAQPASKEGETMSGTTYTIGGEDDVLEDDPNILLGEKTVLTAAGSDVGGVDLTDPPAAVDGGGGIPDQEAPDDAEIPDELDDGEELITEIPVHGVLAPEGVPTGDGRQFDLGALSSRDLPLPLRYETVGTHGGNTSDVVTVGRIDNAWRDDPSNMWRFSGAIVLDKPHAQDVINGLVDGTVRGVSIDADNAEVQVPEEPTTDPTMAEILNPEPTTFSKIRIAGATIVPIPAFQEAYLSLGDEFVEDMSAEDAAKATNALVACGCMSQAEADEVMYVGHGVEARDIPTDTRKKMADEGTAMPDGSYPIGNVDDLKNAIQAIGRASDPEAVKKHIKKRANALGHPELIPEDWAAETVELEADTETFAPGTHDGPGWITHPVPTARIRRYWTQGKGAAKIRWGQGGDFNRCRQQLSKYVQKPEWLAGLCANMHKEALGYWPATHAKMDHAGHHSLIASGAVAAPPFRLVASAATPTEYPHEWFEQPRTGNAEPMTIEGDHIFGYIASWGTCHIGIPGTCEEVPRSLADYGFFKNGFVDTDRGPVQVGVITDAGGHASEYMNAMQATAHYDKPDSVRAYVNIGEDEYGIWYSGVVAPSVTDEQRAHMRAIGSLSGDWRAVRYGGNLEMIAATVVPVNGYQLRRSLAASGGYQTSLVGAGRLPSGVLTASAAGNVVMSPEYVAGLVRASVAEYREQEAISARAVPARAAVRAFRAQAARERINQEV